MLKGGYQIINLDGYDLRTGQSNNVEGIYSKIEGTRKAILISGLTIDGIEYHDCFVPFKVENSNYVGSVYGKTLTIGYTSEGFDTITVN